MSIVLVVGENCYFDVAEANQMIEDNFLSTEVEYTTWNSLSDDEKTIIIYRNTQFIENYTMLWKGCKIYNSNPMQWPRNIDSQSVEIPEIVKLGILLNGIKQKIESTDTSNLKEYNEMINNGIKEYKIKDASVTFKDDAVANNQYSKMPGLDKIYKDIFDNYFARYSLLV